MTKLVDWSIVNSQFVYFYWRLINMKFEFIVNFQFYQLKLKIDWNLKLDFIFSLHNTQFGLKIKSALRCCISVNSKDMRKQLYIWGHLKLKFLCRKNESYMIIFLIIIFFFIVLLHFENLQILFKWSITPLLIIFLTRSHLLIFVTIVSRNLKKFRKSLILR